MRNVTIAVAFLALLLLSCDSDDSQITQNTRAFRSTDTVTIWDYNKPPEGRTTHRNFIFPAIDDSITWTTMYDEEFWIYMYYKNVDHTEQWEFAFPMVTSFEEMNAPEWYTFHGADNFEKATVPSPSHWIDAAVIVKAAESPSIILARRKSNPYPVFALKNFSFSIRAERVYPENHWQEYGFICRTYY